MSEIDFYNFDPESGVTNQVRSLSGPIKTGAVTYDTEYGLNIFARWIYVGTSGDLSYVKWDGTTETLPNLLGGIWHPIPSIQINESDTTIDADQLRWGS